MRVMGINPYHDSSVAIYSDNGLECFFKEERLTGEKRASHPYKSINACLEHAHGPIDVVVTASPHHRPDLDDHEIRDFYLKNNVCDNVTHLHDQHHLTHASLAFYDSGFEEALVVVIDRNGSNIYYEDLQLNEFVGMKEAESVFIASYPCNFKPIYKNYWCLNQGVDVSRVNFEIAEREKLKYPDCEINHSNVMSITRVYESATTLIGQHPLENGKTMGLASYGKKPALDYSLFNLQDNLPLDNKFKHCVYDFSGGHAVAAPIHLSQYMTSCCDQLTDVHANYAYQVQQETQASVLRLIKKMVWKTGIKKVCITGGYGLNVVCNGYLSRELPDIEFFFEPLADDTGNSIGSAMYVYRDSTKDTTVKKLEHTFFHGTKYDLSEIQGERVDENKIVDLLINQKSVGVYNGLAEGGPRALGNRSILFDARNPNAKDLINAVKNREWYRPFAAIVLEEDINDYFLQAEKNPFMTQSFYVHSKKIPGVTHVDGSCRIQTVDKTNEILYSILTKFKKLTGCSVLLNTSFNLAGKPLVETPEDAKFTFENSPLNCVWFPEVSKAWIKK